MEPLKAILIALGVGTASLLLTLLVAGQLSAEFLKVIVAWGAGMITPVPMMALINRFVK